MHLLIDGYGGDAAKMWDMEAVRGFLAQYPSALGMTKLCEPHVLTYEGPKVEDQGVSGFVIIAESHISVHTFPNRSYVNIDIFSCKSFDSGRALRDAKALFSLTEARTWLLDRGLEHLERKGALLPRAAD
jgi:S-adenosylmethionine decarboxylase